MLDIIGWIGSAAFTICAIPQAIKSYKDGHARGITWAMLLLWTLGEICTMIYVWPKHHWPLIMNYVGNLTFLLIIVYYKAFERKDTCDNI